MNNTVRTQLLEGLKAKGDTVTTDRSCEISNTYCKEREKYE